MLKHLIALLFVLAAGSALNAQGSLTFTTQTAPNNGQSGVMFNVTASTAITIYRVGTMPYTGTATATTEVWYRAGGFGAPTTGTGSGWTLAGNCARTFGA